MKYNPFIYNLPLVIGICNLISSWYFWVNEFPKISMAFGTIGLISLGIYDYTLNVRFAQSKLNEGGKHNGSS